MNDYVHVYQKDFVDFLGGEQGKECLEQHRKNIKKLEEEIPALRIEKGKLMAKLSLQGVFFLSIPGNMEIATGLFSSYPTQTFDVTTYHSISSKIRKFEQSHKEEIEYLKMYEKPKEFCNECDSLSNCLKEQMPKVNNKISAAKSLSEAWVDIDKCSIQKVGVISKLIGSALRKNGVLESNESKKSPLSLIPPSGSFTITFSSSASSPSFTVRYANNSPGTEQSAVR